MNTSILIHTRYTTNVAAHGPIVLKLVDGVSVDPPSFTYYNGPSATLAGGANTRVVNTTVTVVGLVGYGGSVTFTNVDGGSNGGKKLLAIDYINADFVFSGGENWRHAYVSINGGEPTLVEMPISGQVS
jgi:alpha-galactosidase